MNDEPHIGLVNTHTESDGGDNHIGFFHQEGILVFDAGLGIKAGMIGQSTYFVGLQEFCEFLHFLPAEAIYDTCLPRMALDELDDILVNILCLFPDLIIEVGTVERGDEGFRLIHTKVLLNVGAHFGCGRRREGDNWDLLADG